MTGKETVMKNMKFLSVLAVFVSILQLSGVTRSDRELFNKPPTRSMWVWHGEDPAGKLKLREAYFRLKFNLPEKAEKAVMYMGICQRGRAFLNGSLLAESQFPQDKRIVNIQKYDLTKVLRHGDNILAIQAWSSPRWPERGLIFLAEIELASGKKITLSSDKNLKAVSKGADNWTHLDFDDSKWQNIRICGDIFSLPWIHWRSDWVKYFATAEEKAELTKIYAGKLADDKFFSKDPEISAKIKYHGDLAGVEVNGKIYPPVFMRILDSIFLDKAAKDLRESVKAGLPFIELRAHSERFWVAPGKFDFSYLDKQIRRAAKLAPDAYFGLQFRFRVCDLWNKRYPDEMTAYGINNGKPDPDADDIGNAARPSYASEIFRKEVLAATKELAGYINRHPWRNRIAYIRISCGVYGEWGFFGMLNSMPDVSKAMQNKFREFIKDKYGSDSALQKAWQDDSVTLSTAAIPTVEERKKFDRYLHDPQQERKNLDFILCMGKARRDLIIMWAKEIKKVLPGRLCGIYYGDLLNGSLYPPFGGGAEEEIISSPYIDFMSRAYSYDSMYRNAGGTAMHGISPAQLRKYNKLAIAEADIRTHKAVKVRPPRHYLRNVDDTVSVTLRDMANSMLNGAGVQFLSLAPMTHVSWFDSPEFMDAMARGIKVWKELFNLKPMSQISDAAVVIDPSRRDIDGHPERLRNKLGVALYQLSIFEMHKTGCAVDILTWKEFLESEKDYRAVVFANLFEVKKSDRKALEAKIRKNGVTSVWVYAPGIITGKGFSGDSMSEITGIKLVPVMEKRVMNMNWNSGTVTKADYGDFADSPTVKVADKKAKTLAVWMDDNTAAAAVKHFADGSTSLFTGLPLTDSMHWQRIFRKAGCKVYAKGRFMFRINSSLLMVHVGKPGKYEVTIPGVKSEVNCLFSGKKYAVKNGVVTLESTKDSDTWLLKID